MKIDGADHILGRLSTSVVEALKDGEDVEIYNADRVIVTGRPDDIIQKYRGKYERGSKEHGPKYPKAPDRMVRRTVRGMLPDSKQGRKMYERLQVYTTEPGEDPHWRLYTGPIDLPDGETTLRAKAVRYGYEASDERRATFSVR